MEKIGIVGAGNSRNIGDQLLERCLGSSLECLTNLPVSSYFDLMTGVYDIEKEHSADNIVKCTPPKTNKLYYPRVMKAWLKFKATEKTYIYELDGFIKNKSLIIIGGGHLLIDNYCEFAIRISAVIRQCERRKVKVVFWAVGVGEKLSLAWRLIIKTYLLKYSVYTRDSRSAQALNSLDPKIEATSVADCALFAHELPILSDTCNQNSNERPDKSRSPKVGVFIMDPYETLRHTGSTTCRQKAACWWRDVILYLSIDHDVVICNNGANSDYAFIKEFLRPLFNSKTQMDNILFRGQARSYRDVVRNVKSVDSVVAQRLHAIIPAIAFQKPFVALRWDKKVESVLSDLDLGCRLKEILCEPEEISRLAQVKFDACFFQKLSEERKNYMIKLKGLM